MIELNEPQLLRTDQFIAGQWRQGTGALVDIVENPATHEALAEVCSASEADVAAAIAAANVAFPAWRAMLAAQRGALLLRWAEAISQHRHDLARIITFEQGKPLAEALSEVDYGLNFLRWYSAEAERIHGEVLQPHKPGRRMFVFREPVGVAVAITPWNFPLAMITRKAGAALAAGCTMIVRPASETPLTALALCYLAQTVDLPAGVLNVVTGDGEQIAKILTRDCSIRAVSFTGSTEVGAKLLGQCAPGIRKVGMELGGHAPFLAFADCDFNRAVNDAVAAKFMTTGQDCLAANLILVERGIYARFCESFVARTQTLKIGYGWDEGVELGPLIGPKSIGKCNQQVADAVAKGARVLCGGRRHELGANFFAPTVLSDVSPEMLIFKEETFGPVAAILPFDTEEKALELANASHLGLAAYLYTSCSSRLWRLSERLEYGMVGANTVSFTGAPIPFGGVKQSGLGREGGRYGVEDFLETKYVCIGVD